MMVNEKIDKMKDLMHRIEHNPYGRSPLTEATAEIVRNVSTADEFFDMLDQMHGGKIICLGYVTGTNLAMPNKVQRYYAPTNRKRSYNDYSPLAKDGEEIGSVVRVTTYNYNWRTRQSVADAYGEYKTNANNIYAEFGVDPIADRKQDWKTKQEHGENGVEVYSGKDEKKFGNTYNPQNVAKAKKKSHTYAIDMEGHIIREIPYEDLVQYYAEKGDSKQVKQLRAMGAEEEQVQSMIDKINALGMEYKNFESSKVLFIAATIDKQPKVFINNKLQRIVDDINIAPEDFIKIATERYNVDIEQVLH